MSKKNMKWTKQTDRLGRTFYRCGDYTAIKMGAGNWGHNWVLCKKDGDTVKKRNFKTLSDAKNFASEYE